MAFCALTLLGISQSTPVHVTVKQTSLPRESIAYALLANNQLVAVRSDNGKVLAAPALRRPPAHPVLWGADGQFYGH
jgi:hypothetical protein